MDINLSESLINKVTNMDIQDNKGNTVLMEAATLITHCKVLF